MITGEKVQPLRSGVQSTQRRLVGEGWDTLGSVDVRGSITSVDTVTGLRGDHRGFILKIKGAAKRLLVLDSVGNRAWTLPLSSSERVLDLRIDRNGDVMLLMANSASQSLTTFARANGVRLTRVELSGGHWTSQIIPVESDRYIGLSTDSKPAIFVYEAGKVVDSLSIPWTGFDSLHTLARQGIVGTDGKSDRWVFAFMLGDGWYGFEGTHARKFQGLFIESVKFPGVVVKENRKGISVELARSVYSASEVAVDDGEVYVRFQGSSAEKGRLIDVYNFEDGAYRSTFLLPSVSPAINVVNEKIIMFDPESVKILTIHSKDTLRRKR